MRHSFNHATIGVNFRFPVDKKPEVLVVNYINEKGEVETRFPAGTVQFTDIEKAIEWYIEEMVIMDSKNPLLWLPMSISQIEDKFKNQVKDCKDRNEKNILLGSCLQEIEEKLFSCGLLEENLNLIFAKCQILTLEREVREETDANKFGNWKQVSNSLFGEHERICFVSSGTEAPDLYKGSGDSDIESSYWMSLENLECKISKKHLNYFFSAINKAVEEKIDTRVDELARYCSATNH
jgi:hypothetical protein